MLAKIKKNYLILIFTVLFLYFFFNLLDGERGLFSYFEKKIILKDLNNEKVEIIKKIEELELKNSLLTDNIDLDYIEILIREKFLFGKKGEKIIVTKKIKDLEFKNSLLTDNLDLDYIEILIRQKFLFGKDGEKVYLIKNNEN